VAADRGDADARAGTSPAVAGNALFFRATYGNSSFFRSRTRVASIGDHIFYR
jgi:spore germination cell wall hydrolase CwlJ-like protein